MTTTPAAAQQTLPAIKKAGSVYTPQDLEKVAAITKWLEDHQQSKAWLSKKASIPNGTLSQILSGKYVSSPTRQLNQMQAVLDTETERLVDGTPGYVKGSVHRLLGVVCDRTRKHQNFGVITGHVGIGKTRFLKEYVAASPMTLLIEVSPNMTPGVLMTELLQQLNNAIPPGLDRKFRELVRILKGTNYLIIADEAENMSGSALQHLRRIRDMAQIGVVLAGTEKLTGLIKPEHGQFDQVRSRVGMWPETIKAISRDDADDMARAALAMDLSDEVLTSLWEYGQGSARVLNENLVPAIKDYGMGNIPLSAQLIETIAAKVLFMTKKRAEVTK
ncbi:MULTISPECIES: ATP-binding protein [unclassified Polaromonas]|jgi:DNA transposition AAA+ family ATPase|uniref:ATP-binding protein n=1 Tax=unclassified Polaromonas TaxID=2638319 RepID=UPI0025FD7951|nr:MULTISPECIES: ATP-binding protein [unclassified Polaromonas]